MHQQPLLQSSDPPAAKVINKHGKRALVLACDHGGNAFPQALSQLGIETSAMTSHIGWDIGAMALAEKLAYLLDAPLIAQTYSRLIYDCNRPKDSATAIVEDSDGIAIPGNQNLSDAERLARYQEIYLPFEMAISHMIDAFIDRGERPAIVSIHSFTKLFAGQQRQLDLGILHDSDSSLADTLLALTQHQSTFVSQRNQPYGPPDEVTHTVKLHGVARALSNVMLEVRNDHLCKETSLNLWAARLATLLEKALDQLTYGRFAPNR